MKVDGDAVMATVLFLVIGFLVALIPLFIIGDGVAKADYLRQEKGIDMPWYKATFIPESVFIDANIRTEGGLPCDITSK